MDMSLKETPPSGSLTNDEIANLTHFKWREALRPMGFSARTIEELMVIKAAVGINLIGGPNDGNPKEQEVFNTQDAL